MTKKTRKRVITQYFGGAQPEEATGGDVTAATGVTLTSDEVRLPREIVLTVAGSIAVTEANGYGSMKLCDLPDSNVILLGLETDLALTKDGTGYIAATDLDVAIGTAAASNTTLSSTMVDVIPKDDLNTDALAVDFDVTLGDETTKIVHLSDAATLALYINVSGATETGEDASVAVAGTVTLYMLDAGNVTS